MIDAAGLRAARPDLVLTQAVCEVCAVPAAAAHELVADLDHDAKVLSLDAHTIDEIFETIRQVGRAAAAEERAERCVAELSGRLDRVRARLTDRERPTVLGLEWLDPPFVPGHWVPEMVELAGGTNLVGSIGARSAETTWASLAGLDPDVLLIMPCGYGLAAARADADRYADRLRRIAPRAIEAGRALVVDASSYFNRSGPRLVDGVEILAALLHRDRFPAVELEGRGARWTPPPGFGR